MPQIDGRLGPALLKAGDIVVSRYARYEGVRGIVVATEPDTFKVRWADGYEMKIPWDQLGSKVMLG